MKHQRSKGVQSPSECEKWVCAADLTGEALAAPLFVNLRSPIAPQRETI